MHRTFAVAMALIAALSLLGAPAVNSAPAAPAASAGPLAFPGALGWAAHTPGGRGGRIIKVTTLASDGPGSLREAVEATGPRIIVFEVGGVIDLGRRTLVIREPFVTIAGQTAPSPGVTLVRGGIDVSAHDVVIQHLRVRPGDAEQPKKSGWEEDAFSTQGIAYNVIIDHCTFTWATDENLSASGTRFQGATPDEWRTNTSHNITYSNNIIAEGLAYSTHGKIEHSKGSLIHDNVNNILIYGNLYAHNYERSPLFKGGVRGAIINNLIYDPGQRAVHYNLMAEEWGDHPYQLGQMVVVGNVMRAGQSTRPNIAFMEIGGYGDVEYYGKDNIAVDQIGRPLPMFGRYTTSPARIIMLGRAPFWPFGVTAMPSADVQFYVLRNAGARPWDRDFDDVRLIADVAEGRGEIVNSQEDLRGYPRQAETRRPFNEADWNLFDMTPRRPEVLDAGAKARGT
ncbi:MAG: pectate lyase [Caulobacteraceae bacterium]